ncbi:LytR family transcriptional regulator, partial [Streptomyces sp. SID6648]|nr:LytR family transcriptional regulator [Streptomyces sp. SID6648]
MTRSGVQGEDTREDAADASEREKTVRKDADEAVDGTGDGTEESRPRRRRRALRWTAVLL